MIMQDLEATTVRSGSWWSGQQPFESTAGEEEL
jgi:hypothetical protein